MKKILMRAFRAIFPKKEIRHVRTFYKWGNSVALYEVYKNGKLCKVFMSGYIVGSGIGKENYCVIAYKSDGSLIRI